MNQTWIHSIIHSLFCIRRSMKVHIFPLKWNSSINSVALAWRLWRYAWCSAMDALIPLLTSSTTCSVYSFTALQLDKHSRSYASISFISVLDALWMFSSAVSRAMSTCWRRESQCSPMFNSDLMNILVSSAVESLIFVRSALNFVIKLDFAKNYANISKQKCIIVCNMIFVKKFQFILLELCFWPRCCSFCFVLWRRSVRFHVSRRHWITCVSIQIRLFSIMQHSILSKFSSTNLK